MKYTTQIPTAAGYYWFKTVNPSGDRMDRIVRVVNRAAYGAPSDLHVCGEHDEFFGGEQKFEYPLRQWIDLALNCDPEWVGPIEIPE